MTLIPAAKLSSSPKILIIGYVWPELTSSAAGLRDSHLIETFQERGWEVLFASSSKENTFSEDLKMRGIQVCPIQINDSGFDDFLRKENPDFVIFDRFVTEEQLGWRVQEICPGAVRILDTQDLHFLRRSREIQLRREESGSLSDTFATDAPSSDTCRELGSIYRCDTTLILSDFEFRLLVEKFKIPRELLQMSRFHYAKPPIPSGFFERKNFVVIGNFRHAPNADGVHWLRKELWPEIRKALPDAEVHIYGAYPSKEMMELSQPAMGFVVLGPTPDATDTLRRYRVNLAPLRFGAGIKGKITDGWWSGTPVITTPVGAEGMAEELPWGGMIGTTVKDFIQKAVDLYTQPGEWFTCQKRGLHLIESLYSRERNSEALHQHCLDVRADLLSRRSSNVVGAILELHAHRSTKYFSKWIEEKNKLPPNNAEERG